MKVKLFTRNGGLVVDIETIPFVLMPEIILWGSRYFVRCVFFDTTETYGYAEGMCWPYDVQAQFTDQSSPETGLIG